MVSSFIIKTTIRLDPRFRKEFQRWAENYAYRSAKAPAYFDQGFYTLPENYEVSGEEDVAWIGWDIDESGLLISECDKFHGAITVLHYCITHFFAPRSVMLNGTIVGINTDYAMAYVYNVADNVISMDVKNTSQILKLYQDNEEELDCNDVLRIARVLLKMTK